MIKLINEITSHKLDYLFYYPSVGVTLVRTREQVELVTSLKQVSFLGSGYSVAFFVESAAAVGVVCMVAHYGYRFYHWARSKIDK